MDLVCQSKNNSIFTLYKNSLILNQQTMETKTLSNTTASQAKDNVKDIIFWGNGDTFKLISKASSKDEGWMKSTKAMQIDYVGCVVQVTTQQLNNLVDGGTSYAVAEAVTFVPLVCIEETTDTITGRVTSRQLVQMNPMNNSKTVKRDFY